MVSGYPFTHVTSGITAQWHSKIMFEFDRKGIVFTSEFGEWKRSKDKLGRQAICCMLYVVTPLSLAERAETRIVWRSRFLAAVGATLIDLLAFRHERNAGDLYLKA